MQGIHLNNADDCIILDNYLYDINYQGINIRYSDSNNIIFNRISNAREHGVALIRTSYDEGSLNTWYDNENKYGNIWSDYFGIGSYQINGPANAIDLYPKHITGLTLFSIIISTTSIMNEIVVVLILY